MGAMYALTATPLGRIARRGARQPRARRVRRLRRATRAMADADPVELLCRHRRRTQCDQLRDRRDGGKRQRRPLGRSAAGRLHRRHGVLLRSHCRRGRVHLLRRRAVRVHEGMAALPRSLLRAPGDVRAGWPVEPVADEPAGDAVPEVHQAARPVPGRCSDCALHGTRHRDADRTDLPRHARRRPGSGDTAVRFPAGHGGGWPLGVCNLRDAWEPVSRSLTTGAASCGHGMRSSTKLQTPVRDTPA